jgi:glutamyl-tRNA reductase
VPIEKGSVRNLTHSSGAHDRAASWSPDGSKIAFVSDAGGEDPLFIIDVAVPRDVEPAVGEIEQAFLYNVDDLQAVVHENLSRRSSEVERAEAIVSEELARFLAWRRSRAAVPTVVALRQRFDRIRRAELQRLEGKLANLRPEDRARVEEVTRLIVEKLLIEPTEQLKDLPDEETQIAYTEAINRLFRLREGEPSPMSGETAAEATPSDPHDT